jgi:transposase-like protein
MESENGKTRRSRRRFCAEEKARVVGQYKEEILRHIGKLMSTLFKTSATIQGEGFEIRRMEETRFVESIDRNRPVKKYSFHRTQPA